MKIPYTYEIIEDEPLTEQELEEIAQILAEMIYQYYYGENKYENT